MTVTEPVLAPSDVDHADITHVMCCENPNRAVCGLDITGATLRDTGLECVDCAHAEKKGHCPKLGECLYLRIESG